MTAVLVATIVMTAPAPVGMAGRITLQETPAAITTFTQENLEDHGCANIADVLKATNQITLRGNAVLDSEGINLAVRGLGDNEAAKLGMGRAINQALRLTNEPVSFYYPRPSRGITRGFGLRNHEMLVDGIRVGNFWIPDMNPIEELERVEVLRGPQGTLFGTRPLGGMINAVTKTGGQQNAFSGYDVQGLGNSINFVDVLLQNITYLPQKGYLAPGAILYPSDPGYQTMASIAPLPFDLAPGAETAERIRAMCLDIGKKEPTPDISYTVGCNHDFQLANILNRISYSPSRGHWDQAQLWMYRDKATLGDLTARMNEPVTERMYAQELGELATFGSVGPWDESWEPLLSSFYTPENILLGTYQPANTTNLVSLAAEYSPSMRGQMEENGPRVLDIIKGLNLNTGSARSLVPLVAEFVETGDSDFQAMGLQFAEAIADKAPGAKQDLVDATMLLQCSPYESLRQQAYSFAGQEAPQVSLQEFAFCMADADDIFEPIAMRTICPEIQSVNVPWEEELGIGAAFADIPQMIMEGEELQLGLTGEGIANQQFSVRELFFGEGTPLEGENPTWTGAGDLPAIYEITAGYVGEYGQTGMLTTTVQVCPQEWFVAGTNGAFFDPNEDVRTHSTNARNAANAAGTKEREARTKRNQLVRLQREITALRSSFYALRCIDRNCVDDLAATYKDKIAALVNQNQALAPGIPVGVDVNKVADDAKRANDDCERELAELQRKLAACETERDNLKGQQDNLLNQVDGIYKGAGFTGNHGYHPDGRYHWGYVNTTSSLTQAQEMEVSRIRREIRRLNRQYRNKLAEISALNAQIAAKKAECERKKAANDRAQEAKNNSDQKAANDVQIQQAWSNIKGKLDQLADAVRNAPGGSQLSGQVRNLARTMPNTPEAWETFWNRLEELLNLKRGIERQLSTDIGTKSREASTLTSDIEDLERDATRLRQQQAVSQAAAAVAQQEARDAAVAARRKRCLERFAAWLKEYEEYITREQMSNFDKLVKDHKEALEFGANGVQGGLAAAQGAAEAMTKGASSAGVGLAAAAQGALQFGAGLFYWYAQTRIEAGVRAFGDRHQLTQALAFIDDEPGECGIIRGGLNERAKLSYFFFRVNGRVIVFRGNTDGVQFLGTR